LTERFRRAQMGLTAGGYRAGDTWRLLFSIPALAVAAAGRKPSFVCCSLLGAVDGRP
jgi:hypothetical protein